MGTAASDAVLGLHRLGAVEEALRAAPAVTAVVVSGNSAELMPLARLVLAELRRCLRSAVPQAAWPRLQVVLDATGALAAAAGVPAVSDATEAAVRITAGRVGLSEGPLRRRRGVVAEGRRPAGTP